MRKWTLIVVALQAGTLSATPLKAALYVDDGCRGTGLLRWAEIFRDSPDAELKLVSGQDIRDGALDDRELLVMPGGVGGLQYKAMGDVLPVTRDELDEGMSARFDRLVKP